MGRSRVDGPALVAAILFAVLALAATARADVAAWETTRKTVIDPINTEFHRHLAGFVKDHKLADILSLYATSEESGLSWDDPKRVYPAQEEETMRWTGPSRSEPLRERYEHIFETFPKIDKAEVRIFRVYWEAADADGYPADVRMIVRGNRTDGSHALLDQRLRMHFALRGTVWKITRQEVLARELVAREHPRFETETQASGIQDVHTNTGSPVFRMVGGMAAPAGSAVADVDGDGCEDVFLPGAPDAKLYKNDCKGGFTEVTEKWGIPHPYPVVATAGVFFDYDNDGRPDLYVTAVKGGDRLFHNVAGPDGPRFVDVTKQAGIPQEDWSSMPTMADYDRDGFLDVYVVRTGDYERSSPSPNYEARNGLRGILLHNERNGTFRDVTSGSGIETTGWGLAGAWGDYDEDGFPDLYVANEYGFTALYHNRHDGTFEDVAEKSGARLRTAGMGVAWGDYDGDGHLDLYVSAMYANSRWALFHPDFPAPIPWYYRWMSALTSEVKRRSDTIIDELTRGSTLLHNNGDGTFTDVSERAGVRDGQWGWGAEWLDYDNDGKLDLFAQNGFLTGDLPDDI